MALTHFVLDYPWKYLLVDLQPMQTAPSQPLPRTKAKYYQMGKK